MQEDQTSATAAAAAPQVLAEAAAPIVVTEPELEDNGLDVRVRGHAKAAGGTNESMDSMLPRMLVQALQAHQGLKPCRSPPNAYNERRFFVLIQGVDGVKGRLVCSKENTMSSQATCAKAKRSFGTARSFTASTPRPWPRSIGVVPGRSSRGTCLSRGHEYSAHQVHTLSLLAQVFHEVLVRLCRVQRILANWRAKSVVSPCKIECSLS